VHLTEKSQETLNQIYSIANKLRDEVLLSIPEQELKQCMTILQKIKAKAETS
jgi:DNA-binding MarR family transcriptional regulator